MNYDLIAEWQSTWQTPKAKPMQVNSLIEQLNAIERKSKMQRNLLLAAVVTLIVASVVFLPEMLSSINSQVSYALLFLAIGVKLVPNFASRFTHFPNESKINNSHLVERLKAKLRFNENHLIVFLILLVLSLNFALLGMYERGTIFNFTFSSGIRIPIHLSTLLIFAIGYLLNVKRLRANRKRLSRLLAQLEA